MIRVLKRWIGRVAQDHISDNHPVPTVVTHNSPIVQVYKINNGYLVSKVSGGNHFRDDNMGTVFCATPMDVARLILNGEVMDKMGIQPEKLSTNGIASAKLGTQTNPIPTL